MKSSDVLKILSTNLRAYDSKTMFPVIKSDVEKFIKKCEEKKGKKNENIKN